MAEFEQRVRENSPGKFYVEWTCIYCDLCVQTAPSVFRELREQGWAFVYHQPENEAERIAAMEAVDGCPTESIGCNGDHHDWTRIPAMQDLSAKPKSWWRFWA